uniref:Uncharacterized protein n=1 Tax=Chelydra serpentina TaxID=8475 RepID=A0A8C3RW03_CHESE
FSSVLGKEGYTAGKVKLHMPFENSSAVMSFRNPVLLKGLHRLFVIIRRLPPWHEAPFSPLPPFSSPALLCSAATQASPLTDNKNTGAGIINYSIPVTI